MLIPTVPRLSEVVPETAKVYPSAIITSSESVVIFVVRVSSDNPAAKVLSVIFTSKTFSATSTAVVSSVILAAILLEVMSKV